jgi:Ca-activated chloride channel homolog
MRIEEERIRKMQADGKITKDQADLLIKALPGSSQKNIQKAKLSVLNVLVVALFLIITSVAIGGVVVCESRNNQFQRDSAQRVNPSYSTSVPDDNTGTMTNQLSTFQYSPRTGKTSMLPEIPPDYVASQGEMLVLQDGIKLALPLKHTDVIGRIDGYLARVTVTQKFVNSSDTTIEAVYTFPLPENAAVDSMIMSIGDRRIKGIIKERGEARAIYEQARRDGKTASLLEQERPNIFTQSVANILKNDTVLVTISYVQELKYKSGNYIFAFPMVVGPRYIPGAPLRPASRGTEPPGSQVPDADKITPPLVPPGYRSGHDISLRLTINAGTDIREVACASHKTRDVVNSDGTRSVEILENDNIPNKDFVLEYAVAKQELSPIVLCHREKSDGFFQLVMVPKMSTASDEIFRRELVFVVDNSGSMMGFPIEKCKEIISLCLKNMRKHDVFRLMKFAGSTDVFSQAPLAATTENVEQALAYVNSMRGGGGTEMMTAIRAIFDAPPAAGRRKLVFFLTDGYIGNEAAIITTIKERLGSARVFGCGVGSSPNRFLIEGMAYNGRGASLFIRQDGNARKAMEEFYSYVDAPVLTDIQLHFNGVEILETAPRYLPDLFAGQPLAVIGKYARPGTGNLSIRGTLAGNRPFETSIDIALPPEQKGNGVLATLWARRKIAEIELLGSGLMGESAYTPDSVKEKITRLGLTYRIMTGFTSFVAVDDAVRNKSGTWVTKEQAVDLPEGVSPASQPANRFMACAKPMKVKGAGGTTGGGGDPRARCESKGALGLISGRVSGKTVASADIFGKGGFATGIDANLQGVSGLKSGGSGRQGSAGIGYGAGYGSGMGGGGVDEMLGGVAAQNAPACEKKMEQSARLKISEPKFVKGGALTGARSRAAVMKVVMQNLASLRYEYNKRLQAKPGLKGKITVKFAMDEFGKIILCEVVETTMNDPELEKIIVEKIKHWVFEKIDKPGDVTEVVYPFVFAN